MRFVLPWIDYQDGFVVFHKWPFEKRGLLVGCGFRWNPMSKTWDLPLDQITLADLIRIAKAGAHGTDPSNLFTPRLRRRVMPMDIDEQTQDIIQALDVLNTHEVADEFIREQYGWECPVPGVSMYLHQKQAFVLGVEFPRVGFFLDMGLGKTLISALILDYLLREGKVKKVLIGCLASNILTWEEELAKVPSLQGRVAAIRDGTPTSEQVVHLSSHELLIHKSKWLFAQKYDMLILDECAAFKNPTSKRSKVAYQLSQQVQRLIMLTGTPATKGLEDIFGQMKILDLGQRFGVTKWDFMYRYFKDDGYQYPKWNPKPGAEDEILDVLSGCSMRKTKEECLDLPSRITIERPVKLTSEQRRYYDDVLDALNDNDLGNVKSFLETMGVFQRISSGYLPGPERTPIKSAKLDALVGLFEEMAPDDKAIVWCRLQDTVKRVKDALDNAGLHPVCFYGNMTQKEFASARERLEKDPGCRAIIMTLAKGSRGLTLNQTNYSIYYELDYDYEDFIQSLDRNYRIGQQRKVTVVHLYSRGTVDATILDAIKGSLSLHERITNGITKNQKAMLKAMLRGE